MQSNWAAEHLLVIRTLMERSAIYRRALAPIVLCLGVLGLLGAAAGWVLQLEAAPVFAPYWSIVGLLGVTGTYLMARQQALKAGEPFWSAPTRRVTQALLPPLFAGFVASGLGVLLASRYPGFLWWLVPIWMVLYGCAVHAAGFFMPRGMKLFGWAFIVAGCLVAVRLGLMGLPGTLCPAHLLMGASFGGMHLAYGVYLFFTEKGENEP